jgi:hypothetical protein
MSFWKRNNTMSNRVFCLAVLLVAGIIAAWSVGAPPAEQNATVFLDHLKVGQPVSVTEKDGRFEIGVYPPTYRPLSHKVVEIGRDYVVLRDFAEITDAIVPVYSIQAIRILRIGGK